LPIWGHPDLDLVDLPLKPMKPEGGLTSDRGAFASSETGSPCAFLKPAEQWRAVKEAVLEPIPVTLIDKPAETRVAQPQF
jgi:hypothetical protein